MPGNDALRLVFTHTLLTHTLLSTPKALRSQPKSAFIELPHIRDTTWSQELASLVCLCVRSLFNCGCGFMSIFGED